MSSVVGRGDSIYIAAQSLGDKKIKVSWSQNLGQKSADYYAAKYTVKNGGGAEGVIFIQVSKLDELKAKKTSGDDLTVTIDDSFQYGQNKEKDKRFLVFHDKNNKLYQHRLLENLVSQRDSKTSDLLAIIGYRNVSPEDIHRYFMGDYLKGF
ncbi:hypothetical protein LTR84_006634 [Exophiala bonariae]|uniref:Uncharacterized protein n=1 Tax=Exophiala bonariae TaxID=1690606 RepID=A0AAV9N3B9_9EURO|nr:hypothetical protein LTR84_006634 [Exophiala bonariae]